MNWNSFRRRLARAVCRANGLVRDLPTLFLVSLSDSNVTAMIAMFYLIKAQGDPSYLVLAALYAIEALYRGSR